MSKNASITDIPVVTLAKFVKQKLGDTQFNIIVYFIKKSDIDDLSSLDTLKILRKCEDEVTELSRIKCLFDDNLELYFEESKEIPIPDDGIILVIGLIEDNDNKFMFVPRHLGRPYFAKKGSIVNIH